ncbi:tripartite tricarboxylate transporter substrate binding protein [Verminephrobacter eiseniae]|uniref:Bug family tripartite tricarboxylate transporter substrate binding protein n=1 Tax=Verminephrobacter eiseniae TaxID=364317 RepID=UPI0022385818|nr:tripartite tricarboxylate transporter substrate binding protein [Verminephrobacter eiseniae]MCW5259062.1 tripartite tricarboxylate transporter substrate binding protein [Verminephrobacter eiseniae]
MRSDRRRVLTCLSAAAALVPLRARAQSAWTPQRPIRLVLGYGAGGATDATARIIGRHLQALLGQPVINEYKPGAGASIGAEFVAHAPADGYTIGLTDTGPMVIIPQLRKVGYDPVKDFTPLSYICATGLALIVHPSVAANGVGELIGLLKSAPGRYSYASSGIGSVHHLAGELFKSRAGVQADHVPYRGAGQALTDLVGGQVLLMMASIGPALPMIGSGKVRALAVTTAGRSGVLPEVPTLAEQGLAGYDAALSFTMVAPARLPAAVAARYQAELRKIVANPAVAKELEKLGYDDIRPRTPAEVGELTRDEFRKWGAVIRDAGITQES